LVVRADLRSAGKDLRDLRDLKDEETEMATVDAMAVLSDGLLTTAQAASGPEVVMDGTYTVEEE
jgi:hypothetical protein